VNKDFLFGGAVGLAIGLVIALFTFQIGRAGGLLRPPEPVVAAPVGGAGAPAPSPGPSDLDAHIAATKRLVEANPEDRRAWVTLGNAYFDADRPQESIEAYERALQLDPDDPNVITDQGVMYVAVRQFDKALANFQRANRLDPNHRQSLFNIGVAYAGLEDLDKAEEAWNRVIQTAPGTPDAERARAAIAQLRARRGR
jgi:cytochrome c-type biogenesis protein CcmH/NrfG